MMSKRLMLILLVSGISAFWLAGCASLGIPKPDLMVKQTAGMSHCIPVVPSLPPSINGTVTLDRQNQRDLLIYFRAVERCASAQNTGF